MHEIGILFPLSALYKPIIPRTFKEAHLRRGRVDARALQVSPMKLVSNSSFPPGLLKLEKLPVCMRINDCTQINELSVLAMV